MLIDITSIFYPRDYTVGEQTNQDAAWFYPHPKREASNIAGYVAFWRGVQVVER